jgi:hypothetical protein
MRYLVMALFLVALPHPLAAQPERRAEPAALGAWDAAAALELGPRLPVRSPRVQAAQMDTLFPPFGHVGSTLSPTHAAALDRVLFGMGYGGLAGVFSFVAADYIAGPFWSEERGLSGAMSVLMGIVVGMPVGGIVGLLSGL